MSSLNYQLMPFKRDLSCSNSEMKSSTKRRYSRRSSHKFDCNFLQSCNGSYLIQSNFTIKNVIRIFSEVVHRIMNTIWKTSRAVTFYITSDHISHLALLALIHRVCLHQVEVLIQVYSASFHVLLETSLRERPTLICLYNFGVSSEFESCAIEHQHLLDAFSLQDAVLQIPILFPV